MIVKRFSNLLCSDSSKTNLRVKKLNVDLLLMPPCPYEKTLTQVHHISSLPTLKEIIHSPR